MEFWPDGGVKVGEDGSRKHEIQMTRKTYNQSHNVVDRWLGGEGCVEM